MKRKINKKWILYPIIFTTSIILAPSLVACNSNKYGNLFKKIFENISSNIDELDSNNIINNPEQIQNLNLFSTENTNNEAKIEILEVLKLEKITNDFYKLTLKIRISKENESQQFVIPIYLDLNSEKPKPNPEQYADLTNLKSAYSKALLDLIAHPESEYDQSELATRKADIAKAKSFIDQGKVDITKQSEIDALAEKIKNPLETQTPPNPGEVYTRNIRIAHWNVCNYGNGGLQKEGKGKAIASIIYDQKYDICAITELDSVDRVPSHLVDLLNEIENKYSTNNVWAMVAGDYKKETGLANSQSGSGDRGVAFLYRKNVVEVLPFSDGSQGKFYRNKYFENIFGTAGPTANEYTRPPFCVRWRGAQSKFKNVNFVYAASHFDGPGVKQNGEQDSGLSPKTGSREANEAYNIKNVFRWLEEETGDDDLVFQGDTNIKYKVAKAAFKDLDKYNILKDDVSNASSLKTSRNNYSEPYDKIIHKSNLRALNPKVYKLWDFVNDNIFQWGRITSISEWYSWCNSHGGAGSSEDRTVYGYVSDHCPISYDLELVSNDPK